MVQQETDILFVAEYGEFIRSLRKNIFDTQSLKPLIDTN